MKCSKCESDNVNVALEQSKATTNNRSILYKIGRFILILCTGGLWLLVPKKMAKTKFKNKTVALCQNCGYRWKV